MHITQQSCLICELLGNAEAAVIDLIKKTLSVFDENNLWDAGVELIGSWCFIEFIAPEKGRGSDAAIVV